MKGLILKDIFGCRFQILCGFAIMFLPMVMMILAGGGMSVADDGSGLPLVLVSVVVYGMVNYCSIVIGSSFYINTLSFDETSGWTKMQRAMPLTGGQIISGKIIGAASVVGILTIVSLVFNTICSFVFEIPLEPLIAMPLCWWFLEVVTLLPTMVLGYRFGAKSVTWVYFVVMIVIAAGIIALTAAFFMEKITTDTLRLIAYAGIPVLTAAVIVLCYVTGKKAVMLDI